MKVSFKTLVPSFLLICSGFSPIEDSNLLYDIPAQTINPKFLMDMPGESYEVKKEAFQISHFVTYKEYKEYLEVIKGDSSNSYYLSQLPDSNIGPEAVYREYITSDSYDELPVLGVSWDNAMNYLKWKTYKEKNSDGLQFIYRLPQGSEWLTAYNYLEKAKISHDFNDKYSDWMMGTVDESAYNFNQPLGWPLDYVYLHKPTDPPALKRKLTLGDSYLFQRARFWDYRRGAYYSYEGFRHIGFRYVIDTINSENDKTGKKNLNYWILRMWSGEWY